MKYKFEPINFARVKDVNYCISITTRNFCDDTFGFFITIWIYKYHLIIKPIGEVSLQ